MQIYSSTNDRQHLMKMVNAVRGIWQAHQRENNFDRGVRQIEDMVESFQDVPEVEALLARCYQEAVRGLIREEEFGDARRWARKLGRLDGDPRYQRDSERLQEQVEQAEERSRQRR
jgi:hypothetical protein